MVGTFCCGGHCCITSHYLAKLDGRIHPASRLISDAKRPAQGGPALA